MQYSLLDFADDLQMVRRPGQMKSAREVDLAEEFEIFLGARLPRDVSDRRQFTDVATGFGTLAIARSGGFLHCLVVRARIRDGTWRVMLVDQPADVAEQVHAALIADAEPSTCAMAIQLPLVDDRAQGRAVQQADQVRGLEVLRVNLHSRSLWPATPHMRRG
jgi:hypothetical protein